MWLKIDDKLYNAEHFVEIWYEIDSAPQPVVYARTTSGARMKLSDEPIMNEIQHALNAKEVI